MAQTKHAGWRLWLTRSLAAVLLSCAGALVYYGMRKAMTGTLSGAAAGGFVGLISVLIGKRFEFQKQHEAVISEKKRDVYRRLLAPWEKILVEIRSNKAGDDLVSNIDFAALYASSFDTVLYGSEKVLQRYVEMRAPETERDTIDTLRALAGLLIAMREDVTGRPSTVSEDVVLRTFVNLKPEELVVVRLREYLSKNPEALTRAAKTLRGESTDAQPAGRPPSK